MSAFQGSVLSLRAEPGRDEQVEMRRHFSRFVSNHVPNGETHDIEPCRWIPIHTLQLR